jgi:hypothetical protein
MRNTADVIDGKPIAVLLQSISGVTAINPLVAFYDIHGGKREVLLLFCPGLYTRHSCIVIAINQMLLGFVVSNVYLPLFAYLPSDPGHKHFGVCSVRECDRQHDVQRASELSRPSSVNCQYGERTWLVVSGLYKRRVA